MEEIKGPDMTQTPYNDKDLDINSYPKEQLDNMFNIND